MFKIARQDFRYALSSKKIKNLKWKNIILKFH